MKTKKIKQALALVLSAALLLGSVRLPNILGNEAQEESVLEMEIDKNNPSPEAENSTESSEIEENVAVVIVDTLDELAEETDIISIDEVDLGNKYSTKRLIVLSDIAEFDTYNAISNISYENLYILSYETEKDCKNAYENLLNDNSILSVEIDSIVTSETVDVQETSENTDESNIQYSKLDAFLKTQPTDTNDVKVAILDSGLDLDATEFKDRIIDLKLNYSNTGDKNSVEDDYGHGTNIGSIISEHTYSNVKLMPIKVTNNEGNGTILSLYMGIESAIENNADIINISLSCYNTTNSNIINSAIDKAISKGIIVVTSAGNDNADTKNYIPANNDNAFTISSINKNLQKSEFSNYGDSIDYCMLGENISCLGLNRSYDSHSGTSYSAALFTSIVSQIKACDLSYTKEDISNILDTYVYDIGDNGIDKYYGKGLLSYNAIIENNGNEQIDDTIVIELNINDVLNWKELSDEKLQDYIYYGSDKNNAYFIQNLSESDLEYILNKNTDLNKDVNYDNYDGLYYEYLMTIDLDTVESNAIYVSSNGYVIFNIKGGPNGNSKIKIKMSIDNPSNGAAQQNVSWSLTTDGSYSNKHSFALTDTATKSRPGKKGSKKADDYNIMVCYCQYTIPAYYKVSSYSSDRKGGGTQRLNFNTYSTANNNEGWQNNGTCTVNTATNLTSNTVDKLTLQINGNFTGLEYADNGKLVHGEYTINLSCIHNYTSYVTTVNPTCTAAGTKVKTCLVCGNQVIASVDALGHSTPTAWSANAVNTGNNHYKYCSRGCGTLLVNETHSYTSSVIANATCTTAGSHRYTCSTCGYYYDSADIPALGHASVASGNYAATCTATGWKDKTVCSRCNAVTNAGSSIAALGHASPSSYSYATNNNISNGLRYKNCTRCSTRLETAYLVSLSKGNYISSITGGNYYAQGASVTVNATLPSNTAQYNYAWKNWIGTYTSTAQKYTFTMPGNAVSLTANATQTVNKYTVTCIDYLTDKTTKLGTASDTKSYDYGATAKGSDWGTSSPYNNPPYVYTYDSCTSATVDGNKTVYRYWKKEFQQSYISIPVTIDWKDENNALDIDYDGIPDGTRPANVTLKLMNGSTVVQTITASGDNSIPSTDDSWDAKFTNIPKYDTTSAKEISYTVVEEAPTCLDGSLVYDVDSSNSGYNWTIVNTLEPEEPEDGEDFYGVTVQGTITWKDDNDKYHFRPNEVIVELYQNGALYDSQTIENDTTSYVFTGLPKLDGSMKLYEYTIVEKNIDNYSITYKTDKKTIKETDSAGNTITTTMLYTDITNTFTPNDKTDKLSNNTLSLTPTVSNTNGEIATDTDFIAASVDKSENIFVTLKQMDMTWTATDAANGIYQETYSDTYSGIEFNMILNVNKTTTMPNILYGKYEIVAVHNNSLDFEDIKELASHNAKFSFENGKYYVTFSYEFEEASEDLSINFMLDTFNGYGSSHAIKNLYKLFLKQD